MNTSYSHHSIISRKIKKQIKCFLSLCIDTSYLESQILHITHCLQRKLEPIIITNISPHQLGYALKLYDINLIRFQILENRIPAKKLRVISTIWDAKIIWKHYFESRHLNWPKNVHVKATQLEKEKRYATQDATCQLDCAI